MPPVNPTADAAPGCGGGPSPDADAPVAVRQGLAYWRSLEDRANSPEFRAFMEREFPEGADRLEGDDRRHFLRVMGASFALAGIGLTGCRRRPESTIVPYAARPADRTPGVPVHYATALEIGGVAGGFLVRSFDGRPIKIEGNPDHPYTLGGCESIAQASVLELYDPDRSRLMMRGGMPAGGDAFAEFEAFVANRFGEALAASGGRGLAVLSEAFSGPAMEAERRRFMRKFPQARWFEWEAFNDDQERAGLETAFGRPVRADLRLADAAVVVSLDADFLRPHPANLKWAREWAATRRVRGADPHEQTLSRLYAFEGVLSLTGAAADVRVPVRTDAVPAVAALLAESLGIEIADAPLREAIAARAAEAKAMLGEKDLEIVAAAASDLAAARGRGVIVAGPRQPAAVHALAALLNERLGNAGETVVYREAEARPLRSEAIRELAALLKGGAVETLVILGGNPVYDAPADLDFADCMRKAREVVHLSYYRNETSADRSCTWHVPRCHALESWGDARAWDGSVSLVQPLIEPLVAPMQGGRTPLELVAMLCGDDLRDAYALVRRSFRERHGLAAASQDAPFERQWRKALNDGIEAGTAAAAATSRANPAAVGRVVGMLPPPGTSLELAFTRDATVFDGRFANLGWLQELPDAISKLTWDNAVLLGVATAERLGVATGDRVRVAVPAAGGSMRSIEAAVLVQPGMADGTLALSFGYGRGEVAGRIAAEAGFDAYRLRSSDAAELARDASIERLEGSYAFARTQDHGTADAMIPAVPRDGVAERLPTILREGTLGEYRHEPDFARHRSHVVSRLSLWEETNLDGAKFRWAMSIDLSTCIGCGACVTACQAENNIPIVGKDQVARGREMAWIRIDRYFRGDDPARPDAVLMQPVTCMHCENAPCEQVCPVAATVHDEDGLNVMVYNRCIGTRYCSNNCPYKVRRFNYFDYQRRDPVREQVGPFAVKAEYYTSDGPDEWLRMQFNPEVTVRTRGVMEKCTFCTQRIAEAKIRRKNEWVRQGGTAHSPTWSIPDGDFTTACAAACPTEAIVFGDLNDPASRVAALQRSPLSYEMLEELNNRPRVRYLARVTNPAFDPHDCGAHGHASAAGEEGASA
jgi:MoCo/4Fe-4S cofactor protein with predicted Tat translocation signal